MIYNEIIKRKGENDMSKKNEKLSKKDIAEIIIQSAIAIATLITALKS